MIIEILENISFFFNMKSVLKINFQFFLFYSEVITNATSIGLVIKRPFI